MNTFIFIDFFAELDGMCIPFEQLGGTCAQLRRSARLQNWLVQTEDDLQHE